MIPPTLTLADAGDEWDAVVVGAGPAGAVAARELARRGLRTLLVDQAQFPRFKVCGGCLNARALATLTALDLGHVVRECGAQAVNTLRLMHCGRTASVAVPAGVSISRTRFDAALVHEAVRSGVAFLPGTRVSHFRDGGGHRTLTLESRGTNVTARARVVIAADGVASRITAGEGITARVRPHSRIGAGTLLAVGSGSSADGIIHMAVGPGGYVGAVNVGESGVDVAAALEVKFVRRHGTLGAAAAAILEEARCEPLAGLMQANWKGTPPLTRRPARVSGHRWFAVGDAAGYVEPFTGEGMAWAIVGAAALAPIAAAAAERWQPEAGRQWQRQHRRLIARRQWLCRGVSEVLRSPLACGVLVRLLQQLPGLAGPFLQSPRWNGAPA